MSLILLKINVLINQVYITKLQEGGLFYWDNAVSFILRAIGLESSELEGG